MKKIAVLLLSTLALTGCAVAQNGATVGGANGPTALLVSGSGSMGEAALMIGIGLLLGYGFARMSKKNSKRK